MMAIEITKDIYEPILALMETQLAQYGYKRSGKSLLFYRYFFDKKVACGLIVQKSMYNLPEDYSFTINYTCISLRDFKEKWDYLTLRHLKIALSDFRLNERIGTLCRDGDYWYRINRGTLGEQSLEWFYRTQLVSDIDKVAVHLNELAENQLNL